MLHACSSQASKLATKDQLELEKIIELEKRLLKNHVVTPILFTLHFDAPTASRLTVFLETALVDFCCAKL